MEIKERNGKLIIVDFNEFESYRIAEKIEKDAVSFYQRLAATVDKSQVKETISFIIEEERKHLKFFENALTKLREVKEDTSEDNDLLASADFGIFWPYQDMDLGSALDSIHKALRLGLTVEDKSIKFYKACLENISFPDAKKELLNIIEEEKRHKGLFESLLKDS